jgi:ABC-type transport system involved in cytochrome c biogenesis permease subunit
VKIFDAGLEAHGFIAVGQFATGVIAFGQVATGVVAVGQLARGVFTFGQVSIGVFAVGQVAIGVAYAAGMLGFGSLTGGLLAIPAFGRLPLRSLLAGDPSVQWGTRHVGRFLYFVVLSVLVGWIALFPVGAMFSGPPGEAVRR